MEKNTLTPFTDKELLDKINSSSSMEFKSILDFQKIVNNYTKLQFINRTQGKQSLHGKSLEDIQSEVLIKLITSIVDNKFYKEKGTLIAYLKRMASNHIIDIFRRNKNKMPMIEIDRVDTDYIIESIDEYQKSKTFILICKYIKTLPRNKRRVINCIILKNKNIKEVSEILKIPINTVKSIFHRAKNDIKKYCKENRLKV